MPGYSAPTVAFEYLSKKRLLTVDVVSNFRAVQLGRKSLNAAIVTISIEIFLTLNAREKTTFFRNTLYE